MRNDGHDGDKLRIEGGMSRLVSNLQEAPSGWRMALVTYGYTHMLPLLSIF